MSAIISAILVTLFVAVSAEAQTHTLDVYTTATRGLDSHAMHGVQKELQRLLVPANIRIDWKTGQSATSETEHLVVVSFAGDCSVQDLSNVLRPARKIDVLGETSSLDGRIFPYFSVDCGAVIQALRSAMDYLSMPLRQSILGRALGRVMAHEIYHILGQTTEHADSGIAKPSFSIADMMSKHAAFNAPSLKRMASGAVEQVGLEASDFATNLRPHRKF